MANAFSDVALFDVPLAVPPGNFSTTAGAVIDFFGVVRGSENKEAIAGIEYDAHREMAQYQLQKIAQAAQAQFGCERLVLHHRLGFVPVGEASLFLRVSAPHRGMAFAASQWMIEQLKQLTPIWKKPVVRAPDAR